MKRPTGSLRANQRKTNLWESFTKRCKLSVEMVAVGQVLVLGSNVTDVSFFA